MEDGNLDSLDAFKKGEEGKRTFPDVHTASSQT